MSWTPGPPRYRPSLGRASAQWRWASTRGTPSLRRTPGRRRPAQRGLPKPGRLHRATAGDAGDDRPLIQPDASQGAAPTIAGLRVYPTPALGEGEALAAQSDQIVVAVRQDAEVAFSGDAEFARDATVARVVARLDVGVNDANGLCVVQAAS